MTSVTLARSCKLSNFANTSDAHPVRVLASLEWNRTGPLHLAISFEMQYPTCCWVPICKIRSPIRVWATTTGPPITWELPPLVITVVPLPQELCKVLGHTLNPLLVLLAQCIDTFSLIPPLLSRGDSASKGPIPEKCPPPSFESTGDCISSKSNSIHNLFS